MLFGKKKQEPVKEEPKKKEDEVPTFILFSFGNLGMFNPTQPQTPEDAEKLTSELKKILPMSIRNDWGKGLHYEPVGILYRLKEEKK